MEETLRVFLVIVLFWFIGIVAVVWPKKIQQKHLKLLSGDNPYMKWVEGDFYVSLVRFSGLFFLVMSLSMTSVRLIYPWVPQVTR
jgi:hypothetical protein